MQFPQLQRIDMNAMNKTTTSQRNEVLVDNADEEWGTDSNLSLQERNEGRPRILLLVGSPGKTSARLPYYVRSMAAVKSAYCLAFYANVKTNCRQDALLFFPVFSHHSKSLVCAYIVTGLGFEKISGTIYMKSTPHPLFKFPQRQNLNKTFIIF